MDVAVEFAEAGVSFILLKGPALSRWLYTGPSERPYYDVDVLVPPSSWEAARTALITLGFSPPPMDLSLNRPRAAHEFVHKRSGSVIDVHGRLEGIDAPPEEAWTVMSASTEQIVVGGREVTMLGEGARTMHVALHAAQHGPVSSQALRDLELALDIVPLRSWQAAAQLASDLSAVPAFLAGLALLEPGRMMAERLAVRTVRTVESQLTSGSLAPDTLSAALGWQWLASRRGVRAKLAYVTQKLLPPMSWMRARYPLAERGVLGLVASYPMRWTKLLRDVVLGGLVWIKARRSSRSIP